MIDIHRFRRLQGFRFLRNFGGFLSVEESPRRLHVPAALQDSNVWFFKGLRHFEIKKLYKE